MNPSAPDAGRGPDQTPGRNAGKGGRNGDQEGAVALAILLLESPEELSCERIAEQLKARFPGVAYSDLTSDGGIVSLRCPEMVFLAPMPVPMPWSDLEGPCATSLTWPDAAEPVRRHQMHVLVTVMGAPDAMTGIRRLSMVAAVAAASLERCIGVYWGNSTSVARKDLFVEMMSELALEGMPLPIWIATRIGKTRDGRLEGFTTGMAAFGLMEFETHSAPGKPGELREFFWSLSAYLLEKGPVVADGNTVGGSAEEKIRVVYAPSRFGIEGRVMRLEYGTPKKKGLFGLW
jgi:hypothetical protein